jgi:hypothetical protein
VGILPIKQSGLQENDVAAHGWAGSDILYDGRCYEALISVSDRAPRNCSWVLSLGPQELFLVAPVSIYWCKPL